MEGQMWPEERILLQQTVQKLRPATALEIGTWKGGGSTFQIASALLQNNYGTLHTCEPDSNLYEIAFNTYTVELSNKYPVILYNNYSHNLIEYLIEQNLIPDFVLMDGPEDPNVCINDLKMLEDHMKEGSIMSFHDWDTDLRIDGLISTKSVLVRPYIESSKKWQLIASLTKPVSVGLSIWQRTNYKI